MKSITNILRRSNITPFERVKALVHNSVQKDKTGKGILSESDIKSISELWKPKDHYEANQYNKYISIAELETHMNLDAQMFLWQREISLLHTLRILDRMVLKNISIEELKIYDKAKEYISDSDGIKHLIQNSYLRYENVLHQMTFYNLPKKIQKDLEILDEYISNEPKYFQDEVLLYEVFNGSKTLNTAKKNQLVDILYSTMYSEKLRILKKGKEKEGFLTHNFFTGICVSDMLYKCAEYLSIEYSKKDMKHLEDIIDELDKYADTKQKTIESIVKPLLLRWINEGLFSSKYTPLFNSDGVKTWNGSTTKTHHEIFTLWYKELQKSKKYLDQLINKERISLKLIDCPFYGKINIITGESMYLCIEDITFINNYKEQVNLLLPLSNIFIFIQENSNPMKTDKTLNEFINLSKEFSDIFDIDMSESYTKYCDEYNEQINMINMSFQVLLDNISQRLYEYTSCNYTIEVMNDGFMFNLDKSKSVDGIVSRYKKELKKFTK